MSRPVRRVGDLFPRAFVTGASTGLGRAFAEMLLDEGVIVWGTSRDSARLAPLAERGGANFRAVELELQDGVAAEKMYQFASKSAGGFDLVINNAGYGVFADFVDTDFSIWADQLQSMLVNTARLSHAALRDMIPRGRGALVNISSLAVEFTLPYQSAYNMAKAGLTALNESLLLENAGSGVMILDVRPGDFRTDFEGAVLRPPQSENPRRERAWAAFGKMMRSGPPPLLAAQDLRRALLRGRSGTLRTGRFFQARLAPFLSRVGSLELRRRIQARYFGVT